MIDKNNAEHYEWGANCDGWHLVQSPELSVIHERMPAGTSEARHFHHLSRQFFFVLSGVVTIEISGTSHEIRALQGLEVAPGVPHQVLNRADMDAEFLVISQPPSHGDRVDVTEPMGTAQQ